MAAGLGIAAALTAATPAAAIGFGPLVVTGTIDGPREGFWLQLSNSEDSASDFIVYATGSDDEEAQPRIAVLPDAARLGGHRERKVLIIASDLVVGETYRFRVCAERKPDQTVAMLRTRVCAKLSAHRVS